MCAWIGENNNPLDFYDDPESDEIVQHMVHYRTLDLMINILKESSAYAVGHKIVKEGPATVVEMVMVVVMGGGISDVLNLSV